MYLIDFFAQLDRYFAVTFPLCVDPTAGYDRASGPS